MTAEIKAKMEAYAAKKAEALRRDGNEVERVRWQVTQGVLSEYPSAEFSWFDGERYPEVLVGQVRIGEYGAEVRFTRDDLMNVDAAVPYRIAEINHLFSVGLARAVLDS